MSAARKDELRRFDGLVRYERHTPTLVHLRLLVTGGDQAGRAQAPLPTEIFVRARPDALHLAEGEDRFGHNRELTVAGFVHDDPARRPLIKAYTVYPTPKRVVTPGLLDTSMFPGLKRPTAQALWQAFGAEVLEQILDNPELAAQTADLPPERMTSLRRHISRFLRIQDQYYYLRGAGMEERHCDHAVQVFGYRTRTIVQKNPYMLLGVSGMPWSAVDALARRLDSSSYHEQRARYAIDHEMRQAQNRGNTWAATDDVRASLARKLGVAPPEADRVLETLCADGGLVRATSPEGRPIITNSTQDTVERRIAEHLRRLMRAPAAEGSFTPSQSDRNLSPTQRRAVGMALRHKVMVLTGGPGVGKTTTVKSMLGQLRRAFGTHKTLNIVLAAPTGKAARRMAESTGENASTIHSLLGLTPDRSPDTESGPPLDLDVLVVDEFSMVDSMLCARLLRQTPDHARVLLVGDSNQLPSVGPGRVLNDLIASRALPGIELTEIHRQGAGSQIVSNAHRMIAHQMPDLEACGGDFHWIERTNPDALRRTLTDVLERELIARHGIDPIDCQVITPMVRRTLGVDELNPIVREIINPSRDPATGAIKPYFRHYRNDYRIGDRVIQTRNFHKEGMSNGDVGVVLDIDRRGRRAHVEFNGHVHELEFARFDTIRHAYAITAHKSQGSEYRGVIIPITRQHSGMLNARLLYTAVTRAREQLYLIGDRRALRDALSSTVRLNEDRLTHLSEHLAGICGVHPEAFSCPGARAERASAPDGEPGADAPHTHRGAPRREDTRAQGPAEQAKGERASGRPVPEAAEYLPI